MSKTTDRIRFASAPDSWGVLDYPGPSWAQSFENMLDEMAEAGYTGTELGPYGFFPTEPAILKSQLDLRKLVLLGAFVPVRMTDPIAGASVVEQIRKVGGLLAALGATFLVMADDQSPERNAFSGRAQSNDCPTLNSRQWKHVGTVVADAERVAKDFGLDLVFHPHVATYVETPEECERFFASTSHTNVGLCLDTGHCLYGGGDPVSEAAKYSARLRLLHIKDCDANVLARARRLEWSFEEAIEQGVFTVVGQGSIDFFSFFRILLLNGYSGWSVVEQDVKFGAEPIPPAEGVLASLTYLRGIVGGLNDTAVGSDEYGIIR